MKFRIKFLIVIFLLFTLIIVSKILKNQLVNNEYPMFLEYSYVKIENLIVQNPLKDDFQNEKTNIKEFFKFHQKNLCSITPRISFNQVRAESGYANRLFSVLSSLLVSILTDSAIIVFWPHINYFIKPPINIFLNCSSLIPEPKSSKLQVYTLKAHQAWLLKKDIHLLQNTKIPTNVSRFYYKSIEAQFMELCMNPLYFPKLLYYDLVSDEAILMEKQNKFSIGFFVGGQLLNKLWLPNEDLNRKIQIYLSKYFAQNFVIGIQLRFGDEDLPYLKEEIDTIKFINCAIKIETAYIEKAFNKLANVKWFISSDSQVNLDILLKKYSSKAFSTQGTLAHISLDPNGYERTIIDHELLSKVDELIITGASTFGFTASMKSKRLPYYIDGFYSKKRHRECSRVNLSDSPQTPLGFGLF